MLRLREDVMLWPGGRMKCCTLSFDDGTVEDVEICRLLRERGLRATFNLNSGLFGARDELASGDLRVMHDKLPRERIAEVYRGFELAVHGWSHARLGSVGAPMAAYEIMRAKAELEDIVRAPVRGMAWPVSFSASDSAAAREAARAYGIVYGRTTRRTFDCVGVPEDFLAWDAACSYVQPELAGVLERFLAPLDAATYREPYLLFVWGHGYEATMCGAWGTLETFFDRVSGRDEVWYATNIEVHDYVQAVRGLVYSATGDYLYNPSALDVWLMVDHEPLMIPAGATVTVPAWPHEGMTN